MDIRAILFQGVYCFENIFSFYGKHHSFSSSLLCAQYAEFDPLRDDGILYASKLRSAGVKVWDKCFAGQIHCLIGLEPGAKPLKEFETMVKAAMKECFAK